MSNQELDCILLIHASRDSCELKQNKLNMILKDYWSKGSVSDLSEMTNLIKKITAALDIIYCYS